jgi:hypothetical protein
LNSSAILWDHFKGSKIAGKTGMKMIGAQPAAGQTRPISSVRSQQPGKQDIFSSDRSRVNNTSQ